MKLYLDLDGVVADFDSAYERKFGIFPEEVSKKKQHFWDNWAKWVADGEFERLNLLPGSEKLLRRAKELRDKGWVVEVLSSSAGGSTHDVVREQKLKWLESKSIDFSANIVPGRRHKQKWAAPDSILIDDHEENVKEFSMAGGVAIHHTEIDKTLEQLDAIANKVF